MHKRLEIAGDEMLIVGGEFVKGQRALKTASLG